MQRRGAVRPSSILAAIFGVAFVIVASLAYSGMVLRPPTPTVAQLGEFVPGVKRWAGDWEQEAKPVILAQRPLGEPDVTIEISVMSFAFQPNLIRVKEGQVVRIVLKALDDGQLPEITGTKEFSGHGFHVLGPYDIWVTGLRKGVVKEITFVATYPGEFDVECPVLCGVGHYLMRGKLIVEEVS